MVLALLLVLAQPTKIGHCEIPGRPLGDALQVISSLTGLKLSAEPALAKQPIIVFAKDVSPKDLLDHIAKVCYGVWVKDKKDKKAMELQLNQQAIDAQEQTRHNDLVKYY